MSFDPVSAVLEVGGKLIDRLWPDPVQAAAAKLELIKLEKSGELSEIAGQLEINKIEAANPSIFVSGWRPLIGWICGVALLYSFLAQPLLAWGSLNFGLQTPPNLDMGTLITLLAGMLGLSGLRTAEKINGVDRK